MEQTKTIPAEINLIPRDAADREKVLEAASALLGLEQSDVHGFRIVKRSIDARRRPIKVNLRLELYVGGPPPVVAGRTFEPQYVQNAPEVVIVGAGPAGLFAALRVIELGYKPIILERGKKVSDRKRDVALLNRNQVLDENSNYCFGEGGAGTFSDGKLYTRSKKRGETSAVLDLLVQFGADPDILIDAHPHIGSDKLPVIIENMRQSIIDAGGYFGFNSRLSIIKTEGGVLRGIETDSGDRFEGVPVILATGHSARDVYRLLHQNGIMLEAKGFAMGVRVEHPQEMIDQIQYHSAQGRGEYLPAAEYSISAQVNNRGVYSFCMCPGGTIVPSSTAPGETVVNGMSNSKRSSPWANSGIVVEIRDTDLKRFAGKGAFAGLEYQQELERLCNRNGGEGFTAPAQRMTDFIDKKVSSDLPRSSYYPGLVSSSLHTWLPADIRDRLGEAFKSFDRRMKGFLTREGVMVGVESRTSSPVRIPRRGDTFEHIVVGGLYPCGEGAGYAGGIVSSAIDGFLCAEAMVRNENGKIHSSQ